MTRHRKSKAAFMGLAGTASVVLFTALAIALPKPLPDAFHPDITEVEIAKLTVDVYQVSNLPAPTVVQRNLPRGIYTLVASGVFSHGGPTDGSSTILADAECSTVIVGNTTTWTRDSNPTLSAMIQGDYLDLYADNKPVDWWPVKGSASSDQEDAARAASGGAVDARAQERRSPRPECDQSYSRTTPPDNPSNHTYWSTLDWKGGDLAFRVMENSGADNHGALTVSIRVPPSRAAEDFVGSVVVPANSPQPVYSQELLVGEHYRFEASGKYQYTANPSDTADGECWTSRGGAWLPKVDPNQPDPDLLDLWIEDGTPLSGADGNVDWVPLIGPGGGPQLDSSGDPMPSGSCNKDTDRIYSFGYTAKDPNNYPVQRRFTSVMMKITDSWSGYQDNVGALTVRIFHVRLLPDISIQTSDPVATKDSLNSSGADRAQPATRDVPQAPGGADPANSGCGPNAPTSPCAQVSVPSDSPAGIATPLLPPGKYVIQVSGIYDYYPSTSADAECSQGPLVSVPDSSWQRNRYAYGAPQDAMDLYVNGANVEWKPKGDADPIACQDGSSPSNVNSVNHVYTLDYELTSSSALRFAIYDPSGYTGASQNSGALSVSIYPAQALEFPSQTLSINSADPVGTSNIPLIAGHTYRFDISGTYTWYGYAGPGFDADAECSIKGDRTYPTTNANYPDWTAHRFDDMYPGDTLDVYMNMTADRFGQVSSPVAWTPKVRYNVPTTDPRYNCSDGSRDPYHTYSFTYTPSETLEATFRVLETDTWWEGYADNTGALTLFVYDIT